MQKITLKFIAIGALAGILMSGFFAFYAKAVAGVNQKINYQGKLTGATGIAVADGEHCMQFKIYDALTEGSVLWTETWDAGTTKVETTNGLFSIMLGSNEPLTSFDFNQDALFLEVAVQGSCTGDYETLSPRKQLGAVPAAFEAKQLGGATWASPGAIGSTAPASGTFTIMTASTSELGTVTSGTWNGTSIGTQYGGSGQNWSAVTAGSIPFFSGTGTMGATTGMFWDNTNARLGIGTTEPAVKLGVLGDADITGSLRIKRPSSTQYLTITSPAGTGMHTYFKVTENGSDWTTVIDIPGQASANKGNIYFPSGNVGIKNTAPGALLDLGTAGTTAGVARFEGATSGYVDLRAASATTSYVMTLPATAGSSGQYLQGNGSGVLSWASASTSPAGSSGWVQFNSAGAFGATSSMFWDNTNSRLGIGLTNPSHTLDINGIARLNGINIGGYGTAGGNNFISTEGAYLYLLTDAGNALPVYTGGLSIASTYATSVPPTYGLYVQGNVGIGNIAPSAYLHIKAGTTAAGTAPLKFTSGTNLTAVASGSMEYDGTQLYFSPSTTRNILAQVSGSTALTAGWVPFATTSGYLAGTSSLFWDNTNARLGIGIVTPGNTLHVYNTNVAAPPTSGSTAGGMFRIGGGTASNIVMDMGVLESNPYPAWIQVANETNLGSYLPLLLNPRGGNVGIGTAAPGAILHLESVEPIFRMTETNNANAALAQTMTGLELLGGHINPGAGPKYTPAIKFGSTDANFVTTPNKFLAGIIGRATESYGSDSDSGMAIDFLTTPDNAGTAPIPSTRMTIDQNGNLGIGTTTPGALLDLGTAGTTAGVARFEGATSGYVDLRAASATTSYVMTLPATAGSSGQYLQGNGSGVLSWASAAEASMTYPGVGIANSTGTAWGTSYTTTGTGTVIALSASPIFTAPTLGVATATSYNGLTLATATTGFTIAGGTTSKTLTLSGDSTINQSLATTSSPQFANLVVTAGGDIKPSANATNAINIAQADGTNFVTFDTTNKRVGIGTETPGSPLYIYQDLSGYTEFLSIQDPSDPGEGATRFSLKNTKGQFLLQAYGSGAPGILANAVSVAAATGSKLILAGSAGVPIYMYANGSYTSPHVVINTSGYVGIGTTAPAANLTVAGLEAAAGTLNIWADDGDDAADKIALSMSTGGVFSIQPGADSATGIQFLDTDGGTPILNIDTTNERLGIGTAAPEYPFDLQAATAQFQIKSTTGTNYALMRLNNNGGSMYIGRENEAGGGLAAGSTGYAGIIAATGSYPLQFAVASAVRMTILGDGKVGIGTTSPNALQENLAITEQLRLSYDASHYASFTIDAAGNLAIGGTTGKVSIGGAAIKPGVTVTVAASNSRASGTADYVCDGTGDQVQIQAAVDAVAALGGGTVQLLEGDFSVAYNSPIYMDSGVSVVGQGRNATTITDGGSHTFSFQPATGSYIYSARIADLKIVGSAGAGYGLIMFGDVGKTGWVEDITIDNVELDITNANGVRLYQSLATSSRIRITNSYIHATTASTFNYGITSWSAVDGLWIENNYITLPATGSYNAIGVYGDTTDFHINNNHVIGEGHTPIAISQANYGEITGNIVDGSSTYDAGVDGWEGGIELECKSGHGGEDTAHHIIVSNNIVRDSNWGIYTRDVNCSNSPHDINISDNILENNTVGINLLAGDNISVSGNVYRGNDANFSQAAGVTTSKTSIDTKLMVGNSWMNPTAYLHIAAGAPTAGFAPLKFTSGTNLTVPASGSMEYDGTQLFFTPASIRNILVQATGSTSFTAGSIPFATANGYLTQNNANLFWDSTNNRLGIGTDSSAITAGVDSCAPDGVFEINTNGGSAGLYYCYNSVWHYSAETAGFQIPSFETVDPISGTEINENDLVMGLIDGTSSNGTLHGIWVKWDSVKQQLLAEARGELSQSGDYGSGYISGVNTTTLLERVTNVLASLGINVKNGITTIADLAVQRFSAKTARMEKMEMVDSATGDIYCSWIENGEWQKAKGECNSPAIASLVDSVPSSSSLSSASSSSSSSSHGNGNGNANANANGHSSSSSESSESSEPESSLGTPEPLAEAASSSSSESSSSPEAQILNITALADIADISVENGSPANLPTNVEATLSDGSVQSLPVTWDNGMPAFDQNVAGIYVFTGTIDSGEAITNADNLSPIANVAVAEAVQPEPEPVQDAIDEISESIQETASGLLNGFWKFIKWIFSLGAKSTAGLANSADIKSMADGLLNPVKSLFSK